MTPEPIRAIARVFPRKTKATPDDPLAFFGFPNLLSRQQDLSEIHVSVTFTYDKPMAERLADAWHKTGIAPVQIGGVAYGDRGNEFIPGRYIKRGYTFTSRGCPRKCTFCSVPLRDPKPRLLPITDGWNILDDNLLATPRTHVEAVFTMLRRQGRRIEFTGGLEARSLKDYQVNLLASLTPRPNMFWAYDPGDTFEVMESAARRLRAAGFTAASHRMRCYVLIGYPAYIADDGQDDTFDKAESRLRQMCAIGFTPMAMLYRPEDAGSEQWRPNCQWRALQRRWARPAIIHANIYG
jgi:hypothetical protein